MVLEQGSSDGLDPSSNWGFRPLRLQNTKITSTFFTLLACILYILCASNAAFATVVVKKDIDALISNADKVIQATVLNNASKASLNGRSVQTTVRFLVTDVFKGSAKIGDEVELEFAGGDVEGHRSMRIRGMPRFSKQQEVILFIAAGERKLCPLVGWWQGVLRIESLGGHDRLVTTYDGAAITGLGGQQFLTHTVSKIDKKPRLRSSSDANPSKATFQQVSTRNALDLKSFKTQLRQRISLAPERAVASRAGNGELSASPSYNGAFKERRVKDENPYMNMPQAFESLNAPRSEVR